MKRDCNRIHKDVPTPDRGAAMEIKAYMEDLTQYYKDEDAKAKAAKQSASHQ